MKNLKLVFSLAGMISGLLLILFGFITVFGGFGGSHHYTTSHIEYDSGYAKFGADYYTYSVNNTAETASAAMAANSNLTEISDILCRGIGLSMICFGLFGLCGFGVVYSGCKKDTLPIDEIPENDSQPDDDAEHSEVPSSEDISDVE